MGRQRIAVKPAAADAARVFGQQVLFARQERNWTAAELADRAGVSARTVTALENGSPTVSLGNAFNIAVTVGVPLYGAESSAALAAERRIGDAKLALMPARVYHRGGGDDVDLDL